MRTDTRTSHNLNLPHKGIRVYSCHDWIWLAYLGFSLDCSHFGWLQLVWWLLWNRPGELMNGKQIDVDLFRYLSSRHHEIVGLPAAPRTEQMWLGCQGRSTERESHGKPISDLPPSYRYSICVRNLRNEAPQPPQTPQEWHPDPNSKIE